VPEPEQYRLFESKRSDRDFLTKVGIRRCVIRCFRPRYPAVKLTKEHTPRISEEDTKWLKQCGVMWERKRAVQLSLDFCDRQETVQET
jgi:hypothetical protein